MTSVADDAVTGALAASTISSLDATRTNSPALPETATDEVGVAVLKKQQSSPHDATPEQKAEVTAGLVAAGFAVENVAGIATTDVLKARIASGYSTSFYALDVSTIIRRFNQWRSLLPRVNLRYAIKCCPDPVLLKSLRLLGTGFDVASQHEMQLALDLGTSVESIIFANPCKSKAHIEFARAKNVKLMTFDNDSELHKVKAYFPDAELVLRILPPDSKAALCNFGSKFGASLRESAVLLKEAKALGLNIVGVSFHVGSGCHTLSAYEKTIQNAHRVFEMGRELGFNMRLLDIGGGFPGSDLDAPLTFASIANFVGPILDELFPVESGVEIIAEPGRYFAAECMTLATNLISRRVRPNVHVDENGNEIEAAPTYLYYITDGVYGSFNCRMYDHTDPLPRVLVRANDSTELHSSTFFGPTCDSIDVICENHDFPKLEVGDWLYFPVMGAYTYAAGSAFNGFALPTTFYVCS